MEKKMETTGYTIGVIVVTENLWSQVLFFDLYLQVCH